MAAQVIVDDTDDTDDRRLVDALDRAGASDGTLVGVALHPGVGLGLAVGEHLVAVGTAEPAAVLARVLAERRLRCTWWSAARDGGAHLVDAGVRPATAWDVAAVHKLLAGGWRADVARVWSRLHDLDITSIPVLGQLDLLGTAGGDGGDPDEPVRPDGHLRPEWIAGGWHSSPVHLARWAATALEASSLQMQRLAAVEAMGDPLSTARCESTVELLCVELAAEGLPVDVTTAEAIIADSVGPRPATPRDADRARVERDARVLDLLPHPAGIDLRSPADVKALLRRVGIDVPDTRAWRLESMRDVHPVVDALLQWRKAERIATTFGYGWLDEHVRGGRLRGAWSSSDGAAGRMTAQAGLHNLPAELRPAVHAEPGWVFVQADLGQIEPRVLAAVSGDRALVQATQADDLYRPVADRLRVERPVAKVAVLAAMYGQTSGTAGQALQGMERAYPVAMQYLKDADRAGREGRELRTFGGRLIRMYDTIADGDRAGEVAVDDRSASAALAGRGRYARNAAVQGAAAELFKAWATTVRAALADSQARIVLCLHDELIVHTPRSEAERTAAAVATCLDESSGRWFRGRGVRFVADVQTVQSWADAKG